MYGLCYDRMREKNENGKQTTQMSEKTVEQIYNINFEFVQY